MNTPLPRGVDWLLRVGVPSDQREPIAGDLAEEYADRVSRTGAMRARITIWIAAARVAWRFRVERSVHGRGLPPIGDEIRRANMWDSIRQDVAFGVRMLRRQPGFTAVAVIVLTLGIGANTAIFSVVDAVLWRAMPFSHGDDLVSLGEARPREGRVNGPVAPADFYDWRRDSRSFAMAAYMETSLNITGVGEPERLRGLSASPGFLDVLAMPPAIGREFSIEEESDEHRGVALLSDSLWRRRFGADPAVIGRAVSFNGRPYDVVGILQPAFWWPTHPDVIVPLALDDHDRQLRAAHFLGVVGRSRGGFSFSQGRQEMAIIGQRLSTEFPAENANHVPSVIPLRDALVGDSKTGFLILLGAVGLVLVIACANVATILLARATTRQREIAVRMAVGGGRGRLVQQMLTESLVLALVGGGAGLLLAAWSLNVLAHLLPASFAALPGIDHLGLDGRVVAASLVIVLVTGLVFGLAPAIVASDHRVGSMLNDGARGSSGGAGGRRLRSTLVTAELALSLVLLVGAGLLLASFRQIMDVAPGFRSDNLVTTRLTIPSSRYEDHAHAAAFYTALLDRLAAAPGIDRAAATSAPPFSGLDGRLSLTIENRAVESKFPVRAHARVVSTSYFQTMGIPLIRGREFTDRDTADAPAVVILNQSAVQRYWQDVDPIGQRISLGDPERWMQIVGVVGDVRYQALETDAEPEAYMPYQQEFSALGAGLARSLSVVVRTRMDAAQAAPVLRTVVAGVDSQQPVGQIRLMDDLIGDSVAPRRLTLVLLTIFALVALALTSAGLYGVMSCLVTERTREIGVRMALGATPPSVLRLIVRQAGTMTAAGLGIGLVCAAVFARYLASLLFRVNAADPVIYIGVMLLLVTVACLAIVIPCGRATRIDPLVALRSE